MNWRKPALALALLASPASAEPPGTIRVGVLRAAAAAGGISGRAVVARMEASRMEDALFGPTTIRPDGRAVHAMSLFRVTKPADSKGPYDLYDVVSTIPAAQAFRPIEQGNCPLVKRP